MTKDSNFKRQKSHARSLCSPQKLCLPTKEQPVVCKFSSFPQFGLRKQGFFQFYPLFMYRGLFYHTKSTENHHKILLFSKIILRDGTRKRFPIISRLIYIYINFATNYSTHHELKAFITKMLIKRHFRRA